jgi:hypothetical protein
MAMPKVDDGTGSTTTPCPLTDTPDMRTDEEKGELLARVCPCPAFPALSRPSLDAFSSQAARSAAHYSYYGPTHYLYKPPATDATVPSPGHIENMPDSFVRPVMALPKVADIDAITKNLPPSAAAMEGPPVAARRGSGLIDTTVDGTMTDPAPVV